MIEVKGAGQMEVWHVLGSKKPGTEQPARQRG